MMGAAISKSASKRPHRPHPKKNDDKQTSENDKTYLHRHKRRGIMIPTHKDESTTTSLRTLIAEVTTFKNHTHLPQKALISRLQPPAHPEKGPLLKQSTQQQTPDARRIYQGGGPGAWVGKCMLLEMSVPRVSGTWP